MKTTHLLSGVAITVLAITAQVSAQTPNPSNGANQTNPPALTSGENEDYETINATPKPNPPGVAVNNLMAPPLNGSIKIQNRGTVNISVALVDKEGVCKSPNPVVTKINVSPHVPVNIEMCGDGYTLKENGQEYIRMHNGHEFKEFPVVNESVYEIYWEGDRWGFHDVTEQRLHE